MASLDTYDGEPVDAIVRDSLPYGDASDPLVLLMGPYRLLDPTYLYPDDGHALPPDPLAPDDADVDPDRIEATLRTVARRVTDRVPATAFIASDVDVPTRTEVHRSDLAEPGMPVIDQSVAFARASAGSAFVFTKAGLTTGVGAEAGAIPEHFDLRTPDSRSRDPRTFCVLAEAERTADDGNRYDPAFSSASIDEMDDAYDLRFRYFLDRDHLVEQLATFVESYVLPLAN